MNRILLSALIVACFFDTRFVAAQVPENFRRENLVAWCIVPFDARQRSPQQRAEMLKELGLKRCAYDWRAQHVDQFEDEIFQYRQHGIDYLAFWDEHPAAFELFQKHKLIPQIWKTLTPNPPGDSQNEKVAAAVNSLLPIAKRTKQLGFPLGLYNHGGWGGEPDNLVAVCQALRSEGFDQVGIVYNFHHGHGHIRDFELVFKRMKPYLLCLNLNGMVDLEDPKYKSNPDKFKILPVGSGDYERTMIQTVIRSGYDGPVGVLGHVAHRDVADVLQENLEGLQWLIDGREKPAWLEQDPPPNQPLVKIDKRSVLDTRLGFMNVAASDRLNQPPLNIQVRARLFSQDSFNILVAKNPKKSRTHFEFYSYAQTGELSFYIPGYQPAEIRTGVDVVDGTWHELGVQFDGSRVELFVDGRRVHRQPVTRIDGAKIDGPLTIGSLASRQFGCDGQIDHVQIDSSAMEDELVEQLGTWSFEKASRPSEIKDESGNNQPTEFVQTRLGGDYLAKWTPKSRRDSRIPYEDETDADWVDHRFSQMDTGPFLNQSIEVPGRGIVPKAIAVRAPSERHGHFMFDTQTMNIEAVWSGEFIALPPARFGILQTPSVAGDVQLLGSTSPNVSSSASAESGDQRLSGKRFLSSGIAGDQIFFQYAIDGTNVTESSMVHLANGAAILERNFRIGSSQDFLTLPLFDLEGNPTVNDRDLDRIKIKSFSADTEDWIVRVERGEIELSDRGPCHIKIEPDRVPRDVTVWYAKTPKDLTEETVNWIAGQNAKRVDLDMSIQNSKPRWGEPISTRGVISPDHDSPYVVDTITIPHDNPFHALMFTSGFDFFTGGDAAVCTVHGDVWIVHGIDDDLDEIQWKRYATGLYHPLGLKIVDDDVIVLCRDRLTRLHDRNGDGEADVYENFNDDLNITGQNHGYAMSLESDPEGNFYFIKSGSSPPHGGTMLKVASDGSRLDVFATGYRHANGLGVSPTGLITSADNEGNWMPATRIDVVRAGGFYGHMPTHRQSTPPETYDSPLLWLPRSMDNSAGGQVWVSGKKWDALRGSMIHLSFGRCTANVVLPQKVGETYQAAAYRLDIPPFLSGSMRGRFSPLDGQLYVCGLDGWQTAAVADGCFQRVRMTGHPFCLPVSFAVKPKAIEMGFTESLDRSVATDVSNWSVVQWNYLWSQEYGSDHYSVIQPDVIGHDPVPIESVWLSDDGRTILVTIENLKPVMQMNLKASLRTADGKPVTLDVFNTINRLK